MSLRFELCADYYRFTSHTSTSYTSAEGVNWLRVGVVLCIRRIDDGYGDSNGYDYHNL